MPVAPMFSVVMPVFLGEYRTAARDRESKFIRAVESVWSQTFMDWELRIVCDGCERSKDLSERWEGSERIHAHLIEKQPMWSGRPRNAGIAFAKGQWIVYLDSDDQFGADHLAIIAEALKRTGCPADWAWFNHYEPVRDKWREVRVYPDIPHRHSTFNFIHRRKDHIYWPEYDNPRYGHDDRTFAALLAGLGPGPQLTTPDYRLCHMPGKFDK